MFRALTIFAVLVLFCVCAGPLLAQTNLSSSNYTDDSRTARPVERPVSPEARAEAKRLYKEGVKYGLAGLYSQAAEIFERALKLDPQYADAYYALGHAYFDMRQWKKAIDNLEKVIEINPKDQDARDKVSLARTMLYQGSERPASRVETNAPQPAGVQVSMTVNSDATPPPAKIELPRDESNAAAANDLTLTKIYRVGPNDVLDIRINDSASQSTLFTVTAAGLLEHPMLAEPLHAGGLTVDEISSRFESDLKRRALMDNPKVSVGVRDYASHTILVSGLVKDSETKILRREAIPLYVVVADAQPLPEAAKAMVVRNESNEAFDIDLTQAAEMNLLVRPGDVITLLANVTQFVYVGGEVRQPGEKTFAED